MMLNNNSYKIDPSDVARYFLYRANFDGELISPLKMQKLVYYAYVWGLIKKKERIFDEEIEAWPNGPVVPSLYQSLKVYGAGPIDEAFLIKKHIDKEKDFLDTYPDEIIALLNEVYEEYISKSAFELVVMTHNEKPWMAARQGLGPTENSNNKISDEDIMLEYGEKEKKSTS